MLVGLLAAATLAVLLQLCALRARRSQTFEYASGVIHMRCWTVVETPDRPAAFQAASPLLALPAPVAVRRPEPLQFVGTASMLRPRPPARTPARERPVIHAGSHGARRPDAGRLIYPTALVTILPPRPAWAAPPRAPPARPHRACVRATLLH